MDKTPAELREEERQRIEEANPEVKVEEDKKDDKDGSDDNKDDKGDEGKAEEEKVEEGEEEGSEEEAELNENDENIEASKKKEEDLKKEKKDAKSPEEKERIQKRIEREVNRRKAAEAENAELKKQLAAKKADGDVALTEEDVETRAEQKASQKDAHREFIKASNRLYDKAEAIDKEFGDNVKDLADDISPLPSVMVGILDDLDNGAHILVHLTKNHDEYEKLCGLNPVKMGVELAKLDAKLAPKKEAKKISKVPKPNETVKGNGRTNNVVLHDGMDTKTWIETRNAQQAAKGKR